MIQSIDYSTVKIKENSKNIKIILSFLIFILLFLSCAYFLYWGVSVNEEYCFDAGLKIFSKLTGLFNLDINTIESYKQTSFYLFYLSIFVCVLHSMCNSIEKMILNFHFISKELENKTIKERNQKLILEEKRKPEFYSIVLSIETNNYKDEKKSKIRKIVYERIYKNIYKKYNSKVLMYKNNALIIISKNYNIYDGLFLDILFLLSNIKKELSKAGYNIIPSITTDLEKENYNVDKTSLTHFAIKKCINNNRTVATDKFVEKYKNMKLNKFSGTPIGSYVLCEKNEYHYDLNIIHKDLSKILDAI